LSLVEAVYLQTDSKGGPGLLFLITKRALSLLIFYRFVFMFRLTGLYALIFLVL